MVEVAIVRRNGITAVSCEDIDSLEVDIRVKIL
jgi:hypothetical protein